MSDLSKRARKVLDYIGAYSPADVRAKMQPYDGDDIRRFFERTPWCGPKTARELMEWYVAGQPAHVGHTGLTCDEAAVAIRALQDELAAATRIIEMQGRELRALRGKA